MPKNNMVISRQEDKYCSPNYAREMDEKTASLFSKNFDVDDNLTNLTWLQSIDISLNAKDSKIIPAAQKKDSMYETELLSKFPSSVQTAQQRIIQNRQRALIFKHNRDVKPPYSYSNLICMALQDSEDGMATLSEIYAWIMRNFAYYRPEEMTWQNSVRHNLSLNRFFEKMAYKKNNTGKGSYWRINPECAHLIEGGLIKRRKRTQPSSLDKASERQSPVSYTEEVNKPPLCYDDHHSLTLPSKRRKTEDEIAANSLTKSSTKAKRSKSMIDAMSDLPSKVNSSKRQLSLGSSMTDLFNGIEMNWDELLNDTLCDGDNSFNDLPGLDNLDGPELPAVDCLDGNMLNLSIVGNAVLPPDDWSKSLSKTPNSTVPIDSNAYQGSPYPHHPWSDVHQSSSENNSFCGLTNAMALVDYINGNDADSGFFGDSDLTVDDYLNDCNPSNDLFRS